MIKDQIVINATALDRSGALTILEQFVESIPPGKFEYTLFVNSGVRLDFPSANVKIVYTNIKTLLERFLWDSYGIKHWLMRNEVNPLATISLQNTNFRTSKSIPNFIYFHNAIPLSEKKWNILKKNERGLWFYKYIYPFFVRIYFNRKTEIFVQSDFIKHLFAKYFKFPIEKIHTISPKIKKIIPVSALATNIDKSQLNLFYPATPFIYKNHYTIIKALTMLDQVIQQQITLHLTCAEKDLQLKEYINEIRFHINFMGKINFNKVLQMYYEADALLFPSYIETIGLPLIEAASTGMSIIVADLPYSSEVLKNYDGAVFVPFDDSRIWGIEILKLFELKGKRFNPLKIEGLNYWPDLFRILENRIITNMNIKSKS